MGKQTFYITTPIYYVNDKPHIGHAYTTIAADVLARFERMRGKQVIFLTGTDENSQKNIDAAEKAGEQDLTAYLNRMSATWQETWDSLGITNDDFIRTTEPRHLQAVRKFWDTVLAKGDIYKGKYEGWFCVGCEGFKKDSDLVDGKCPLHPNREPNRISEENYFFKLSKYRDLLLAHIEVNPDFIGPASRKNEIVSYIKDFMEDVSISRQDAKCGIPVPGDASQAIYVWFDALVNYISAVGYGGTGAAEQEKFTAFWPGVHLVGKDIIKFHCALWPAMLMSAGLALPTRVFAHGFFTIDGLKISKSLGNAIDPLEVSTKYGLDTLRFTLLREINFGEDGDFSFERMETHYRTELAGELGNLVYRVLSMCEKYTGAKVPAQVASSVAVKLGKPAIDYAGFEQALTGFAFHEALAAVWTVIREANKLVDDSKPWALAKAGETQKVEAVMYELLEMLRHIGRMLLPILPNTGEGILRQLGVLEAERGQGWDAGKTWGGMQTGGTLVKENPLFPQLEAPAATDAAGSKK